MSERPICPWCKCLEKVHNDGMLECHKTLAEQDAELASLREQLAAEKSVNESLNKLLLDTGKQLVEARAERDSYRSQLIGELRSLLSLANSYCANSTANYTEKKIHELEAAAEAERSKP